MAPELIHNPKNSLLSPTLSKNAAVHVVVLGIFCLRPLEVEAYIPTPNVCCPLSCITPVHVTCRIRATLYPLYVRTLCSSFMQLC